MFESLPASGNVLIGTAATLAIVHTVLGIDHSLPFVALGRARGWTLRRTLAITSVCGLGHVASSVVIGIAGIGLGVAADSMLWLESARGELAAALLIGFGLAYTAWAIWRRLRRRAHSHVHAHPDGTVHSHPHTHEGEHLHPHDAGRRLTVWTLFIVFLLGPCEPLIPLMVVPAVAGDWLLVAAVVTVFGLLTVAAMIVTVALAYRGLGLARVGGIGRYGDALAGVIVAASGAAVLWLGL